MTGSEVWRKAIHIGTGGLALLLRWSTPAQAALVAAGALAFNLLVLHRMTGGRLLREVERRRGFSWGVALYPAVVLMLIVVFRARLELAAAVWGLLAFGDGMATLAGVWVGGPRLPWNREKTWAGFGAFVLYGTAAAALLLRWTQRAALDGGGAGEHVGGSFLATTLPDAALPDPVFLLLACALAATTAALAESLDSDLDDNLRVPLAGGLALFAATLVEPGRVVELWPWFGLQLARGLTINAALAAVALASGVVRASGAAWGVVAGGLLFACAGWRGWLLLLLFVTLGTATTRLRFADKARRGIAQERGGSRGAANVLANTLVAVGCAVLAQLTSYAAPFIAGMVGALAAATCDTVSTEAGQAFGRRHYLPTTLRRVPAGSEGAVSLVGTLAGGLTAAALVATAWGVGLLALFGAAMAGLGAVLGATVESFIGAGVGTRRRVDHHLLNVANTLIGAATACTAVWLAGG